MRMVVRGLADPEVIGTDRLDDRRRRRPRRCDDDPPPLIFAPNHHSHLDTALMVRAVPLTWRRKLVVAAAADYFFDKRWKATLAALSLNAMPIDRESTGRRSADLDPRPRRRRLEPRHLPGGWPLTGRLGPGLQGRRGLRVGADGRAVVPVFIDGTGSIFGKGMKRPKPGRTRGRVRGADADRTRARSTRRFNARIQAAVTTLADEATTDCWTARRRAADGTSPTLGGPTYTGWRRQWDLVEAPPSGHRRLAPPPTRKWPDLG